MFKKRRILALSLAAVFFLFTLEVVPRAAFSKAADAAGGRALIYGRGADSDNLDPANTSDGESAKVLFNIFEGLVRCKQGSTEVEPCLATGWRLSQDGLTLTFYLRRGVKFHDGTPLDADAVVFSFNRQMDPKNPYYGKFEYWEGIHGLHIKEVKVLDKYTVQIILKHPFAPILSCLAMYSVGIVSPTAMQKLGREGFEKHPVGTGPFKFAEWIPDDRIVLEANQGYWGKKPKIERLIYKVIKDNKLRQLQLESGAIDVMDGIDPDSAIKIQRNPNLVLSKEPGINVGYLAMNCEVKPFTDRRVRQAINYAVNKEPIVKLIYQNLAVSAKNPMPPTLWGYNDEVRPYEYDPEKAKELLSQAGYSGGFEFALDVMENPRPYMPEPVKIAEAIKENLAVIGIKANISVNKWQDHRKKLISGPRRGYQAAIYGWYADFPDPDNFLYMLLDKDNAAADKPRVNFALYSSERLHNLLIEAQQVTEQRKRVSLYREAQAIIHDDAPWLPIAHAVYMVGYNKKVKGILINPGIETTFLTEARIEE